MRNICLKLGGFLLALFLLSGCSPSRFVAGRLLKAPNSYPTWFAPEPRVYLGYQDRIADQLQFESLLATWSRSFTNGRFSPSGQFPFETNHTHLPSLSDRFASDPARLVFRVVPPADYQLKITSTNWVENGREKAEFDFRRAIPAPPLPGLSQPHGTVVLLHGYGLDQDSMLPWAFWLGERGWQSVLVDLRGHGRSSGRSISFGPVEAMELTALLTHLRSSGRAPGPVVALGVSYGAAIALRWAGEDPRLDSAVAIAPYSQLDVAIENVRADFASWVPAAWIRAGARRLPEVLGVAGEELDTLRVLARRPIPALFLAGANDTIAPPGAVEALQNVSSPGSRLWVLHGSNHEALPFRFQEMAPIVERWMDERKQSHR